MSRFIRGSLAPFTLLLVALSTAAASSCAHGPNAPQHLEIERLGGVAGFGGPGSHLQSHGEIDLATLSPADRRTIESLFSNPPTDPPHPDELRYRLSRPIPQGVQTVEVPEDRVPDKVKSAVKDQLR